MRKIICVLAAALLALSLLSGCYGATPRTTSTPNAPAATMPATMPATTPTATHSPAATDRNTPAVSSNVTPTASPMR